MGSERKRKRREERERKKRWVDDAAARREPASERARTCVAVAGAGAGTVEPGAGGRRPVVGEGRRDRDHSL